MDRDSHYLLLPEDYAAWLGGVRWSNSGDAIEYGDGATFALSPQIALFLEGFDEVGRPPHFAHVLHFLQLLGYRRLALPSPEGELAWLFEHSGRPLRNAGALAAFLCLGVPHPGEAVDVKTVCRMLARPDYMGQFTFYSRDRQESAEAAPLEPDAFAAAILRKLRALPKEAIQHWLRHGCAPVEEPAKQIAEEMPLDSPKTLGEVMDELSERRRLAGAVPFVAQLVSALALPPRRLDQHELPIGGYADVATRGHPEQILPSQFAVDDLEFVRRFAENELLFFRREDQASKVREELIVLLDQGVRTWGAVRLVLTAAVVALSRRAERGRLSFMLSCTSSGGQPVNPLDIDGESLGKMLEASDFSPHPGLALEGILEEPTTAARDVVLLSHPRALGEADVSSAARRLQPPTRLFSLSVNDRGDASLDQISHGAPVKVRSFRVDMSQAVAPSAEQATAPSSSGWTGAVEPIGFPFRFVICGKVPRLLFDFSVSGKWLLVAGSENGLLHAYSLDGSGCELLPRGMVGGKLLTRIDKVIGVAGGFVVIGHIDDTCLAMHYDFSRRRCLADPLHTQRHRSEKWQFYYLRHLHSLVADCRSATRAIDLATGACYPSWSMPATPMENFTSDEKIFVSVGSLAPYSRAQQACAEAHKYVVPPPQLLLAKGPLPCREPYLRHDLLTGRMDLRGLENWEPFLPEADGKPALTKGRLIEARLGGDVLAALFDERPQRCLRLFRGPQGVALGECPMPRSSTFTISRDGGYLARQIEADQVEVRDVATGAITLQTPRGRSRQRLTITLGKGELLVRVGNWDHRILWLRGRLELYCAERRRSTLKLPSAGVSASPAHLPAWVRYDPERFVVAAKNANVVVVGDIFGQIAFFDHGGKLICMLFFAGEQVAAWMPDGTRHGPAALGGQASPRALDKIAAALRAAGREGGTP